MTCDIHYGLKSRVGLEIFTLFDRLFVYKYIDSGYGYIKKDGYRYIADKYKHSTTGIGTDHGYKYIEDGYSASRMGIGTFMVSMGILRMGIGMLRMSMVH